MTDLHPLLKRYFTNKNADYPEDPELIEERKRLIQEIDRRLKILEEVIR